MFNRKQTLKNAMLTVVQVLISALLLFVIYRYMLLNFDVERIGVWSIVMAISTVAKIGDFGFAGGMTRFVAKYNALEQPDAVAQVIETAAVSLFVIIGIAVLVAYPIAYSSLPLLFKGTLLIDARELLPYALSSFGILAIAGVFLSALDGMQRADRRNMILIVGTTIYAVLIFLFADSEHFVGLGYAQLGQACLILVISWAVVRKTGRVKAIVPHRWSLLRFKEMFSYNANLQITILVSFLLEPATKILLGKFGDLSMVGYFEMASKMVAQFRAIVVNVNQVLVPVITQLSEKKSSEVRVLYEKTYNILLFVSITFYSGLIIVFPLVSEFWLGKFNQFFVLTGYLIICAMMVNTMVGPAYFSNMGTGRVQSNTKAQSLMGIINILLALLLGWILGGAGVIIAYCVSIIIGSLHLIWIFMKEQNLPASLLLPRSLIAYVIFCAAIAILMVIAGFWMRHLELQIRILVTFLATTFLIFVSFKTSIFSNLLQLVFKSKH